MFRESFLKPSKDENPTFIHKRPFRPDGACYLDPEESLPKKYRKISDDECFSRSSGTESEEEKKSCYLSSPTYSMLTCPNGHTFCDHSHKKKPKRFLCPICEEQRKEEERIKVRSEEEKYETEMKMKQQRLFEEAKQKLLQEQSKENSSKLQSNIPVELQNKIIQAYEHSKARISHIVDNQLQGYRRNSSMTDYEYNCTKLVSEFLMLPETILKCYFFAIKETSLKSEYKKSALRLHPDKNKHPQSQLAFSKLSQCYQWALETKDCPF